MRRTGPAQRLLRKPERSKSRQKDSGPASKGTRAHAILWRPFGKRSLVLTRHEERHPRRGSRPLQTATRRLSGLRFLRGFRLARTVEGNRLANERLEGGLVNFFSFVDVDRAACVSVETRVEETGRILQRRALGEGKLHDILVGFAGADDAVVRPNRSAHPLPLLDDVRVCFLDELAHSAEGFPAPVPEFGDSFRDELRCRLALARGRLFHVLILVWRPANNFLKAVESESQFFRAKAADKPSKIVKLFAGRDTRWVERMRNRRHR